MPRRKKKEQQPEVNRPELPPLPSASWVVTDEFQVHGRWLKPGTEFTVEGVRGRMRFLSHTQTPTAEWIDCFSTDKQYRAFRPERVKTVHYITRTRENSK
jgi:hypothetical protein